MKAGWEVRRLGDLCEMYQPRTLTKKELAENGQYPVFGANGIMGWHDQFNHADPELLIGCRGACGTVHISSPNSWITGNSMVVRPRSGSVLREFLRYFFLGPANLNEVVTGAAQPQITQASLKPITVPIPPLDEQKRIVAVLDEAFEGLSRARANAETNLADARELFSVTLATLMTPSTSWAAAPLAQHVKFVDYRGKTPPKREQGVRLITAKNVKMGFVQRSPEEYVDPGAYDDWMTRGLPRRGDVLFTTEAPLANVAQLDTDEKVMIGQRLITMQPDPRVIDPTYLKFQLMSPQVQEAIRLKGTGATVTGIKASLLKLIQIRFPANVREQDEVAMKCEAAFEATKHVERKYANSIENLTLLRQALLQKAFSGELT